MDTSFFLPILTLVTLLAVAIFAYRSAVQTDKRRHDPNAPKSTLAADVPSHAPPADVER
ncbi:MAG: hypothetical protein ACU0BC_01420 [Pseudooceanicola nanhaiensis]